MTTGVHRMTEVLLAIVHSFSGYMVWLRPNCLLSIERPPSWVSNAKGEQ